MQNNSFSKFDDPSYTFEFHQNKLLKKYFQRLWLYFLFLALVILIITLASIIIAGDLDKISSQIRRLFAGNFGYCDDSMIHAAACLTAIDFLIIIPFLLVLSLVAFRIARILKDVPQTLAELDKSSRLIPKSLSQPITDLLLPKEKNENPKQRSQSFFDKLRVKLRIKPRSAQSYAQDFQAALLSPWRYILFLFWLAVSFGIIHLIALEAGLYSPGYFVLQVIAFLGVTILPAIVAYLIASWIWIYLVIGFYLHWIPHIFDLEILPWHEDKCGGFKKVGDLSFKMAFTISLPAILFGTWGELGYITLIEQRIPSISLVIFVVIAIIFTLAGLSFFLPIIGFHNAMAKAKVQYYEEKIAERLTIESELQNKYNLRDFQSSKTQELLKRLEIFQALNPSVIQYPTWPIDIPLLLGFITSQILPILGGINSISEFFG